MTLGQGLCLPGRRDNALDMACWGAGSLWSKFGVVVTASPLLTRVT